MKAAGIASTATGEQHDGPRFRSGPRRVEDRRFWRRQWSAEAGGDAAPASIAMFARPIVRPSSATGRSMLARSAAMRPSATARSTFVSASRTTVQRHGPREHQRPPRAWRWSGRHRRRAAMRRVQRRSRSRATSSSTPARRCNIRRPPPRRLFPPGAWTTTTACRVRIDTSITIRQPCPSPPSNPPMRVWPAASRMRPPTSPNTKNRYRIVPIDVRFIYCLPVRIGLLTPSFVPRSLSPITTPETSRNRRTPTSVIHHHPARAGCQARLPALVRLRAVDRIVPGVVRSAVS